MVDGARIVGQTDERFSKLSVWVHRPEVTPDIFRLSGQFKILNRALENRPFPSNFRAREY